jgi:hypothetical protein
MSIFWQDAKANDNQTLDLFDRIIVHVGAVEHPVPALLLLALFFVCSVYLTQKGVKNEKHGMRLVAILSGVTISLAVLVFAAFFLVRQPDLTSLLFSCDQLGDFALDRGSLTIYQSSDPGITQKDAVPVYRAERQYGFWLLTDGGSAPPGEHVWRRYWLSRESPALTMTTAALPADAMAEIESAVEAFTARRSRVDRVTFGQNWVAKRDNLVSAYLDAHGKHFGPYENAQCFIVERQS